MCSAKGFDWMVRDPLIRLAVRGGTDFIVFLKVFC